jgi:hypothetical protein
MGDDHPHHFGRRAIHQLLGGDEIEISSHDISRDTSATSGDL